MKSIHGPLRLQGVRELVGKVKVKFSLEQATKAQRGVEI
jgi:hypothetical protein